MKDYERLTSYMQVGNKVVAIQPQRKERIQAYIDRLFDLENKIESGELIDINKLMTAETTRDLSDKEIEFFIKHNEKVRKETAREILKPLREVVMKHSACCVNLSEDIKFLWRKYGLESGDEE